MAEKEGFEPSRQLTQPTPLAGEPLRPLGYFSIYISLAEREGFEPPVPLDITGFQDQRLKPLGHLSNATSEIYYIASSSFCQHTIHFLTFIFCSASLPAIASAFPSPADSDGSGYWETHPGFFSELYPVCPSVFHAAHSALRACPRSSV